MKVQVPGEAEIRARAGESFVNTGILSLDLITNHTSESVAIYARGFRDAIDMVNEQLASTSPTTRPFLSDGDITIQANSAEPTMLGSNGFYHGARWARDKYEAAIGGVVPVNFDLNHVLALLEDIKLAAETNRTDGTFDYIERTVQMAKAELAKLSPSALVEPKWQPVFGQLIKGWDGEGSSTRPAVGYFVEKDSQLFVMEIDGVRFRRSFCALVESIDEIGKPPQYFIERGRCTV